MTNVQQPNPLQASEDRFQSSVTATSMIVWNTNPEGQVITPMPSWSAYTGQSEADILGWGWIDAVHLEDRDRVAQIWTHALQTKTLYETDYRLRGADGTYRHFEVRGVPAINQDGSIREWVGACTDKTERKQLEAEREKTLADLRVRTEELTRTTLILAQTATILEKRNQELDQFAYVVSHDLKAPLRAIANLAQWIEEDLAEVLTDETRRQMELLQGRVHRMEALINGLLQYSRVGRVALQSESVSVGDLLQEVVDSLAPPAEFVVEIAPDMPTLKTDRLSLQQVFANLISNAIKHHDRPDGHVWVTVSNLGKHYEFAVKDDGKGIAQKFHDRVFTIFQTLEARDKVENTGIGLSLVKKTVESRGGAVWLESAEGQGATFRFTWAA
ncbi:MAG: PAS domain-containing protein [Phormidesmis sp. CAN_BIN44]|nr:PAS domain-containing protein [Phormidesmis sp. CAN_BIN44]